MGVTLAGDYALLTDVEQLHKLATAMLNKDIPVGFDVETGYSGPDFPKRSTDHFHPNQFTVGFSLTSSPEWARYVPLRHDCEGNVEDPKAAWQAVEELLTKGNIVAHNAKFEMHAVQKAANIDLCAEGKIIDTMIDSYVLAKYAHKATDKKTGKIYPYRTMLGLKDLVLEFFNHRMTHIEELWPDMQVKERSSLRFNTLDLNPLVVSYACEDAAWVLALSNVISIEAQRERPIMRGLEHKIFRVLRDMETQGVSADWDGLKEAYSQALEFGPNMEEAVREGLSKLSGRDLSTLNFKSTQQMKQLFYRDMGLKTTRLTKKGQEDSSLESWERMSTDAKAMKALADENPEIKKLLEFREVNTLTSSRLKKWITEYCNAADGKVHANYKQAGVEESSGNDDGDAPGGGRFSAAEPAIQGLQKDWRWTTELGFDPFGDKPEEIEKWNNYLETGVNGKNYWHGNYRNFIIASPGTYLLTYDYSQIELRVLAGLSQEPALLEAFEKGIDIHSVTAAQMLGKRVEDINLEVDRPIGKTLNFALLYGEGPQAMGEQLGKTFDEAKALYEQYFAAFSKISSWIEKQRRLGMQRGYSETIFGRRYTPWELYSPNKAMVAKGRRVLVNAPIQGAAADYMKIAMLRVYNKLKSLDLWLNGCTIIMNNHDSLTFEVSNDIDPNWIRPIIEEAVVFGEESFKVLQGFPKVVADWELGFRWGSSAKWKPGMIAKQDSKGDWFLENGEDNERESERGDIQQVFEENISDAPIQETDAGTSIQGSRALDSEEDIIYVSVTSNPTKSRFKEFINLIKETPGDRKINFICPEGSLDIPLRTSLGLEHQGKISLILGGASVKVSLPNMDDIMEGIVI